MMNIAKISEIFYSISGEGISQGLPTVFVRLSGCSLRCGKVKNKKIWCDTKYALSPNVGKDFSVQSVIDTIYSISSQPTQVLLTGGEPLETPKKRFFCQEIAKVLYKKRHNSDYAQVRVETNGRESIIGLKYMVFSIDYKLPGSGMESSMNPENFHYIRKRKNPLDEVKFVIRDQKDFERSIEVIQEFKLNTNFIYSAVFGEMDVAYLAELIKSNGPSGSRLSLQLHKILWGNKRGV